MDGESDDEEEKYELCGSRPLSKKDVLNKFHFAMTTNLMMDKYS